tara:strand:+ start:361 stop:1197 length:837 start_codon:yes stop_codon:yes gene_type:complete
MLNSFRKLYFLRFLFINPIYFFKKIFFKLYFYISKINYEENKFINEQNNFFKENNLNRQEGLKIFSNLAAEFQILKNETSSEHQILLSSISKNLGIKNILEIGTYNGINSFMLSKLFSSADIDTIDLPDDDYTFKNTYGRDNSKKLEEIINIRNNIMNANNKINFIQKNSVNLINEEKKYDLIWIDGAHGYPVVTMDIINSVNLLSNNGIILCDDVWIDAPPAQDKIYHSLASYETLIQLKENNIIDFTLFYKRLDIENNSFRYLRKYIAYIKKYENN